jgi:hypothetical protein
MTTYEIGKSYVALVREGRREECLSTLFSPDAVSVEAVQLPGRERTVKGLEALRGKSQFFLANNEVHKAERAGSRRRDRWARIRGPRRPIARWTKPLRGSIASDGRRCRHVRRRMAR